VASGDRLVAVELAGLPACAAGGGLAVKLAKQVPATPECEEDGTVFGHRIAKSIMKVALGEFLRLMPPIIFRIR
jgi:hypothetical protein